MVIHPITFLVGKESVLRDKAIANIRQKLFKDPSSISFNQHIFDASSVSAQEILNTASTAPFLSEKRLVIIHRAESMKESDRKIFLKQIQENKTTIWILTSDEKANKNSFLKQISAISEVVSCETPYKEGDIRGWVRRCVTNEKKSMDAGAMDLILELIGKNLTALAKVVEQLAIYVKDKNQITRKDAESLLGESAEHNIFNLYDALKEGQFKTAWKILKSLELSGKRPHEILASLNWQFDRMVRIKNFLNIGLGPGDIASKLYMHPFFVDQAIRRVRRLSEAEIKNDLKALIACEMALKQGGLREDLALEKCILSLNQAQALSRT